MNPLFLQTVLSDLIDVLHSLGIRYHLTGGLVSSYFGEPRMTQDIDVVVLVPVDGAAALVERLSEKW